MGTTIKWNADLFGVEIKTEDEHFVISAQPSMVMSWHDAVRYFNGNEVWQLPTIEQLRLVAQYVGKINMLLRVNGGYEIRGFFWSSEENGKLFAWDVFMGDGEVYSGRKKTFSGYVRTVSVL